MSDHGDLAIMIASEVPLIVIESHDERGVLELLARIAVKRALAFQRWSAIRGLESGAVAPEEPPARPRCTEPTEVLDHVRRTPGPALYALCDLHPWLGDEPLVIRRLREIALDYPRLHNTVVLISPRLDVPRELSRVSAGFDLALPDRDRLLGIVRELAEQWSRANAGRRVRTDRGTLDRLLGNLRGVTEADARTLIRHAIYTDGAITEADLPEVNRLKFELLDAEGVLHFEYDVPTMSDVAGLQRLRRWLDERRALLRGGQDRDRPRGLLLLGVQGGGKSLAARCIAGECALPLLQLDFGALYNKYIGETERNLRESLRQAERMAPCVLWMDEIEKGLDTAGADNATARRVLGTLLTWLAENDAPVFVVATANDVRALPPELLRKGRFDEIFFVDLPDAAARRDIFTVHLGKRGYDVSGFDLEHVTRLTEGFTGAEIEQAVVSARHTAAARGGVLDDAALARAVAGTVPLSVTMAEEFAALRAWAVERTVPAH